MKRKLSVLLLAIIVVLCCAIGLTACSSNGAVVEERGEDGHLHVADYYQADKASHWKTCGVCDEQFAKGAHNLKSGTCPTCGYVENYTEGLKYLLNSDESSYSVTGIGSATVTDLIIPAYYNGLPVTSVYRYAFSECKGIVSVTIPDSVTSIGLYAFSDMDITSVTLGKNVKSIGLQAFAYCRNLTSITIPDSVTSIGNSAFEGCRNLSNVTMGNCVKKISRNAFRDCAITSINIPESVTHIGESAFYGCTSLVSVVFKQTNGWWFAEKETATSGTAISSSDLSNPTTAATCLTSTYVSYYWNRT